MKRYETTIGFSGFYCSLHNEACDHALEQMFADRATGCHINDDLVNYAMESVNWRAVYTAYAKEYTENFALHFGLDALFTELVSPREYNFETDAICAAISEDSLLKVFKEVKREELEAKIKERFTSRSGFISFYSNNINTWDEDPRNWDHNEIGTLLLAYVGDGFDQYQEFDLMDASFGNGFLDNILYANCPAAKRLLKIRDYLEVRAARETETV